MTDDEFKSVMVKHISDTEKFQQKVETALFGDDDSQIPGLAKRVHDNEKYIEKDKRFKQKMAGGVAVMTPALVLAWDWIKQHILNIHG